jgi:abortive infection alpha-like protein
MAVEEEFAKQLVNSLPIKAIYRDAAAPAAKQTGQLFEDLLKVLQLALAPVQMLGAIQDRYRNFLDTAVRRVPEANRISPAPQIIGPVLEGVRYEPEDTPIDQMFSELLSRSMDRERVNEAHPAYPIIIKQLSSDEAKILSSLKSSNIGYYTTEFYGHRKAEFDRLPRDDLSFRENVSFYLDHLNQLGLAGIFQIASPEPLFGGDPRGQVGIRVRFECRLTSLGQRFVRACIS